MDTLQGKERSIKFRKAKKEIKRCPICRDSKVSPFSGKYCFHCEEEMEKEMCF